MDKNKKQTKQKRKKKRKKKITIEIMLFVICHLFAKAIVFFELLKAISFFIFLNFRI